VRVGKVNYTIYWLVEEAFTKVLETTWGELVFTNLTFYPETLTSLFLDSLVSPHNTAKGSVTQPTVPATLPRRSFFVRASWLYSFVEKKGQVEVKYTGRDVVGVGFALTRLVSLVV
jgi:hypothetical protein